MKIEGINAAEARKTLSEKLGMTPVEGTTNGRGEFWITRDGYPHFIPYTRNNQRDEFAKAAFENVIDKVSG